jgi:hypothetical protein
LPLRRRARFPCPVEAPPPPRATTPPSRAGSPRAVSPEEATDWIQANRLDGRVRRNVTRPGAGIRMAAKPMALRPPPFPPALGTHLVPIRRRRGPRAQTRRDPQSPSIALDATGPRRTRVLREHGDVARLRPNSARPMAPRWIQRCHRVAVSSLPTPLEAIRSLGLVCPPGQLVPAQGVCQPASCLRRLRARRGCWKSPVSTPAGPPRARLPCAGTDALASLFSHWEHPRNRRKHRRAYWR